MFKMKRMFLCVVSCLLIISLLSGIGAGALADVMEMDQVIVFYDTVMAMIEEIMKEAGLKSEVTRSVARVSGKPGSVYFDLDEYKIVVVGNKEFRTYQYKSETIACIACGAFCYFIQNAGDASGCKVAYLISDGKTEEFNKFAIEMLAAKFEAEFGL